MLAPLPSRRRGSEKGLDNLSVSSRPRVPSYAIGRDRGEEWGLEYLRYLHTNSCYPTCSKGKSDLQPTSKEHVYHVEFYAIPYIRVHIQSWHIANARKKPHHVLDSMYRIGVGSEISLFLICMIQYHCTDSSGNIFACTRLHAGLRWWLLHVGVSQPPQSWHLLDATSHV